MNPEEQLHIGFIGKLKHLTKSFYPGERLIFCVLGTICIISGLYSLIKINQQFLVEVPAKGGTLSEGMVGSPRFINPVLAVSDTDKSIAKLVYSGLLKPTTATSTGTSFEGDLASSLSVSPDGLVYTVVIKDEAVFQDNTPVTADDVLFTIEKALDPVIKSPKRANWEGVSVEKISDKEITFTLKKAYFPFLENLTLGILPKHVWQDVTAEEFAFSSTNINPIGSGPYKVSSVTKNSSGSPTNISLKPFNKYVFEDPYISHINLSFYQNENIAFEALENGEIIALGSISPEEENVLTEKLENTTLVGTSPRIFGAFFNQNQAPVFANKEVRQALDAAIDKQALTEEILNTFGVPLSGPTPNDVWSRETPSASTTEAALEILTDAGWTLNADGILEKKLKTGTSLLSFSISTSDVPDLKRTAEILKEEWTKLGAQIDIKVFDSSDLSQNVIKPRKYDMLLFGEVVGPEDDLYPFWHSSERLDPGLNISLYTNITADKLLDDMRNSKTLEEWNENLTAFKQELNKDTPAIFLYSPKYIYSISKDVKNVNFARTGNPEDRFGSISNWYIDTAKVWSIFADK